MKKLSYLLLSLLLFTLAACSNETNEKISTAKYVASATIYGAQLTAFVNGFPLKLAAASISENKTRELHTELVNMKSNIQKFNKLTPPESFADKHNQIENIVNKNLLSVIDVTLPETEKGIMSKEVAAKIKEKFNQNEYVNVAKNFLTDIKELKQ